MDIEEIENEYSQEIVFANDFFLTGLKSKTDKTYLEKKYKERLDKNRERYYKRIKTYLIQHKYKKELKKQKVEKTEKKPEYNYKKNLWDKINYDLKILKFKIKIKTRQFRDRNNIKELNFKIKKVKIKIKHIYGELNRKRIKIYNSIKYSLIKHYETLKENYKKTYEKLKEVYTKIEEKLINLVKRFKKEKAN